MVRKPPKDIKEVISELGKFPVEAFQFVQEGLAFTVEDTHGTMTETERHIHEYLHENSLDLEQLTSCYANEQLPEQIQMLLEEIGGPEVLNRHVSGQNLCWGLRDYALKRWGALAQAVLNHWNISKTRDFGEIVFALVDNDFLQKQPNDKIDDFADVYEFPDAFKHHIEIDTNRDQQN